MKNSLKSLLLLSGVGVLCSSVYAISGSDRIVCGTNDQNEIWCTTSWAMGQGRWERVRGVLKQVVVRDGQLWGVNPNGDIFYSADIKNPQWIHLQGKAKEITEGHGVLCHVNDKDEIWCADKGITTPQPEWHKAPDGARLKYIAVN
jgi:hypothetical protein